MLALWARIVVVGLLLIHGLAHWGLRTLWPGASARVLGDSAAALGVGDLLSTATLAILLAAAVLLALGRPAWRAAAVVGGLLSIATMVVLWDPSFRVGLTIDVLFVGALVLPSTFRRLERVLGFRTEQAGYRGSTAFGGSKGVHA